MNLARIYLILNLDKSERSREDKKRRLREFKNKGDASWLRLRN